MSRQGKTRQDKDAWHTSRLTPKLMDIKASLESLRERWFSEQRDQEAAPCAVDDYHVMIGSISTNPPFAAVLTRYIIGYPSQK
mmetsp:Transcript_8295/g.14774  ORF Transcript_8295/g.14774 Transcript_8295/m.14774 type:complete len:83 (+) Transcript_8295:127-375(+)